MRKTSPSLDKLHHIRSGACASVNVDRALDRPYVVVHLRVLGNVNVSHLEKADVRHRGRLLCFVEAYDS